MNENVNEEIETIKPQPFDLAAPLYENPFMHQDEQTGLEKVEIKTIVAKMPPCITPIISKGFQDALSIQNPDIDTVIYDEAYLAQVVPEAKLSFEKGVARIFNYVAQDTEFQDYITHEHIQDINIGLLDALFSIILYNIKDLRFATLDQLQRFVINNGVEIYIPDLIRFMGIDKVNQANLDYLWKSLQRLDNVIGIRKVAGTKRTYRDSYRLLEVEAVKSSTNTIRLASPYMNEIIWELYHTSVKMEKRSSPYLTHEPRISKFVSYQNPKLASLKNKRAVEIVLAIVALMEQCGIHGTPHIKASTIIGHCPILMDALQFANKNSDKTQILKRSFSAAWEYIRLYTDLEERFGVQIPDVDDTPTINNYDTKVYEFPRIKRLTEKKEA